MKRRIDNDKKQELYQLPIHYNSSSTLREVSRNDRESAYQPILIPVYKGNRSQILSEAKKSIVKMKSESDFSSSLSGSSFRIKPSNFNIKFKVK